MVAFIISLFDPNPIVANVYSPAIETKKIAVTRGADESQEYSIKRRKEEKNRKVEKNQAKYHRQDTRFICSQCPDNIQPKSPKRNQ